jgi:hypothetical protein
LRQYPNIAKHIAELLPKNIGQAMVAGARKKTSDTLKILKWIGAGVALTNPLTGFAVLAGGKIAQELTEDKKLTKAETLACKLAKASSENIIEIAIQEIGEKKFGQSVSEELEKYRDSLMPLEKLADLLETEEKDLNKIEPFIYGNTPMKETLGLIKTRFEKESAKTPDNTIPLLFILSDGAPTDGDPLPIANVMKQEGIRIVSCLITDEDLISPRNLFNEKQRGWSREAVLMYNMASSLGEDSVFAGSLKEYGWKVPDKSKMFVQVNHSEVLDEFIQIVLDPIRR